MLVVGECAGQVKLNLPAGRVLGAPALLQQSLVVARHRAAVPADHPPPHPLPMLHWNATSDQTLQLCRGVQLSSAVPSVTEGLLHYFLAPQFVGLYLKGLDFGQEFPVLNFIVRYSHKPILIILAGGTQGSV